jgi:hypothetical protein
MTAESKAAETMHRYPRRWKSGAGDNWGQESEDSPVMYGGTVTLSWRPSANSVADLEADPEVTEVFDHLPPLETPTAAEQPPFKVGDRVRRSGIDGGEGVVESLDQLATLRLWVSFEDGSEALWSAADCTLVAPATVADGYVVIPEPCNVSDTARQILEITGQPNIVCNIERWYKIAPLAERLARHVVEWKASELAALRAEVERVKGERDAYAREALIALAGAVCTPEKGFVADGGPGLMADCIRRLRRKAEEDAAELAQLREQLAEATTWRPIETAPKDGTPVLLGLFFDLTLLFAENSAWKGNWPTQGRFTPSHWLPLPPAPAAINAGGGGE